MPNHKQRAHALLGPSSAHRWLTCTPSAVLEDSFPDTESEAAREGTLAHEICEIKLKHFFHIDGIDSERKKNLRVNKLKKNELYKSEMDGFTDDYLDYVRSLALACTSAPTVLVEASLDLGQYVPESFGTVDCLMLQGNTLHVIDFKYGKGVPVDSERNPQLMLYALGAHEMYKIFYNIQLIELHIVQPRISNTSTYKLTINELNEFGKKVKEIAPIAFKGEGEFKPSEEACRFCRARTQCRARAMDNLKLFPEIEKQPPLITNAEVGEYLRQGADVANWLKDLQDYALSQCLAGEEVPGWKVVAGRGSRDWTDQEQAFEKLKANGIDEALLFERKALTLAQVEKTVGKTNFESLVGDMVVKHQGKPTLVVETDKREVYNNMDENLKLLGIKGD